MSVGFLTLDCLYPLLCSRLSEPIFKSNFILLVLLTLCSQFFLLQECSLLRPFPLFSDLQLLGCLRTPHHCPDKFYVEGAQWPLLAHQAVNFAQREYFLGGSACN
jgi:hypothetical protein